jgi:hypothetical protein
MKSAGVHEKNIKTAKGTGNEANVKKAESDALAFLRKTEHRADAWRATIDEISMRNEEIWIEAQQGRQKFRMRIIDPTVKGWANSRSRGEKIEFSGILGSERSFTLSGGLDEPEFTFFPDRIRLMSEKNPIEQSPQILQAALAQGEQKSLESRILGEIPPVCQAAVEKKLEPQNQASFSWLKKDFRKTGEDLWVYRNSVDAKNRMGATTTYRYECNVKVTLEKNGELSVQVRSIVFL